MKHLVVFFTIGMLSLTAFGDVETKAKSGTIEQTSTEEGEERRWEIGTTSRSEFIFPSNYGSAGIFRVRSAESLPPGTLTFGLGGEFYTVRNAPDVAGTGSNANTIAESLFIGLSPTDRFTLAMMRRNSSTTYGVPQQLISSLGDFYFSALYSFPLLGKMLVVAPVANLLVASDFNNLAPAGNTFSAGGGLASTFTLYPLIGIPLFAHANLLYHMPQVRDSADLTTGAVKPETFFAISRYHSLTLALGAELKIGDFIPFVEYHQFFQMNASMPAFLSPSRFTVGTRFTPLENKSLAFLLGADIGAAKGIVAGTPFNPDWQVVGQVSYTVAVTGMDRKHYSSTSDVKVVNRRFVISKNINFKVGSAELEEESKTVLDQIAQVVKENHVKRLHIVGHTDSSHTDDFNVKLSLDRANTVKYYLAKQGIAEEGLSSQGYGKRKPKASNTSETGRAQNRRVEFFILE